MHVHTPSKMWASLPKKFRDDKPENFQRCRLFLFFWLIIIFLHYYQDYTTGRPQLDGMIGEHIELIAAKNPDILFKNPLHPILIQIFTSLATAWIADSYVGKYMVVITDMLLSTLALVILVIQTDIWTTSLFKMWQILQIISRGMITARLALIADQLKLPQSLLRLFAYFLVMVWMRSLADVIAIQMIPMIYTSKRQFIMHAIALITIKLLMLYTVIKKRKEIRRVNPEKFIIERMCLCIFYAIKERLKGKEVYEHWLDYAEGRSDALVIVITKRIVEVLIFLSPTIIFLVVSEFARLHSSYQQTHFTDEALMTEYQQTDLIRETMALIIIPFLHLTVFPIVRKLGFRLREVQLMGVSQLFICLAMLSMLITQGEIDRDKVIGPDVGFGQVRLYNSLPFAVEVQCKYFHSNHSEWVIIPAADIFTVQNIHLSGKVDEPARMRVGTLEKYFVLVVTENEMTSYVITFGYEYDVIRLRQFEPIKKALGVINATCFVICSLPICSHVSLAIGHMEVQPSDPRELQVMTFPPHSLDVQLTSLGAVVSKIKYGFKSSSVHSIMIYRLGLTYDANVTVKMFDVMRTADLNFGLLFLELFLLSAGETLFYSMQLVFGYTQPPPQLGTFSYAIVVCSFLFGKAVRTSITDTTSTVLLIIFLLLLIAFCFYVYLSIKFTFKEWTSEHEIDEYRTRLSRAYSLRELPGRQ